MSFKIETVLLLLILFKIDYLLSSLFLFSSLPALSLSIVRRLPNIREPISIRFPHPVHSITLISFRQGHFAFM